jgi:predicted MFS family arabinose efflux permease
MTTTATYGTLSASEHSTQLRKAVIASTIGTAIEWYDFFLYGTAAGLIFGKLFFPNSDPLTATLAAFGTYFIGFVGRPIGAAIFGHYGDRIGRKATLIATLLCMGIATFLIAFVPTYETVGIWGAVILTVLRMIQGIGVGGEWGGSVLLAMEWSRHPRPSRLGGVLAAIRRAVRPVPGESRCARLQPDVRRSVRHLGLAHSLRAVDHSGRRRPVDPPRHFRNAGVPSASER